MWSSVIFSSPFQLWISGGIRKAQALTAYLLLLWALRHICKQQRWHLEITKGASFEAQWDNL